VVKTPISGSGVERESRSHAELANRLLEWKDGWRYERELRKDAGESREEGKKTKMRGWRAEKRANKEEDSTRERDLLRSVKKSAGVNK
jgi:hypothetical protein